jgi:glycosyltransferase involved in cell wall biosynthesis
MVAEMRSAEKSLLYIDVSHTWSSNLQTGMQKVVRELCAVWSSENYECRLVVFQDGHYKVLPREAFSEITRIPMTNISKNHLRKRIKQVIRFIYFKLRQKIPLKIRALLQMSKSAKKLREFFNPVLFVQDYETWPTEGARLLILESIFEMSHTNYILNLISENKAIVIFFSYDLIPINHRQYCSLEATILFERYIEISRNSKKLWSISQTTKSELENYVGKPPYLTDSKYKWLPPTSYPGCEHKLPFDNSKNKPYLLLVSSFEPRKNHLGFFDALQILKADGVDVPKVVLIGGSSWDDGPITKRIRELTLGGFDLIKLLNIDECCVGKLYQGALLTVYPSFFEGFGFPIVESLSYGVPVLTSNIGSTGELLQLPGTFGFIVGDSMDLAKQLKYFLTNQSAQKTLKEDAIRTKDSLGTWSEYAADLYTFSIKE